MTGSIKRTAALHFGVFFVLFAAVVLAFSRLGWPWHFVVPFGVYALLSRLDRLIETTLPGTPPGALVFTPPLSASGL